MDARIIKLCALVTTLNIVALLSCFVVGWAPGPGTRDLGGGFTTDTSTANTLSFKLNGTEFLRATANGIVTPRVTAGTPGVHALPTTAGQMYSTGGVYTITGSGFGVGCAAPSFNGVRILKGTNPLLGFTDAVTLYTASASETLAVTGEAGVGGLDVGYLFATTGIGTNGQGIDMRSGRQTPITTAVVQIPTGPSAGAAAASGTARIMNQNGSLGFINASATSGNAIVASLLASSNVRTPSIVDYASTGAPALTRGFTVPAGYGGTFACGADPAAPAAGSILIYGDFGGGTGVAARVASVEKSDASTKSLE